MKTTAATTAPIFVIPNKKEFNVNNFEKELLKALGFTLTELKKNNIVSLIQIFSIGVRDNFVIVDNGYGNNRTEYLKLSYGKSYFGTDTSMSYGEKVTFDSKINDLREHTKSVMNNLNANKNWGSKIKTILTKNDFFRFIEASIHENDGTTTTTINLGTEYSQMSKFGLSVDDVRVKVIEKDGKKDFDYDYKLSFSSIYGKKNALKEANNHSNGVLELEHKFSILIRKIESL
jgi:virulence-associated protein VapD